VLYPLTPAQELRVSCSARIATVTFKKKAFSLSDLSSTSHSVKTCQNINQNLSIISLLTIVVVVVLFVVVVVALKSCKSSVVN